MAINIKTVNIEKMHGDTIVLLCQDDEGFYINVAQRLREAKEVITVAKDIKNLREAKIEFLNVVWELS